MYLKLVLQSGGGALAAVLVHYHYHVCQRVHLDLLGLQVALQGLTPNKDIRVTLKQGRELKGNRTCFIHTRKQTTLWLRH